MTRDLTLVLPLEKPKTEANLKPSLTRAAISGLGTAVPSKKITNQDLEKMVDTTDEWIVTRTGIRERRMGEPGLNTSDLCIEAAEKALKEAKLTAKDLDLIMICTVTPDVPVPATACIVQDRLGARKIPAFDLNGGCTGFMYGMAVATQFIETGMYKHILVIGADMLSRITDWTDRSTCILFGDGAGAVILSASDSPDRGILDLHLKADGSGGKFLTIPAGGTKLPTTAETLNHRQHYLKMEGRQVFKFAVRAILDGVTTLLERNHLKISDIDCFVFHQANLRILENASAQLGIPMEKIFTNLERYGNTSSASVPLAMYEAGQAKKFKEGSVVLMLGFGAGLTWASALVRI